MTTKGRTAPTIMLNMDDNLSPTKLVLYPTIRTPEKGGLSRQPQVNGMMGIMSKSCQNDQALPINISLLNHVYVYSNIRQIIPRKLNLNRKLLIQCEPKMHRMSLYWQTLTLRAVVEVLMGNNKNTEVNNGGACCIYSLEERIHGNMIGKRSLFWQDIPPEGSHYRHPVEPPSPSGLFTSIYLLWYPLYTHKPKIYVHLSRQLVLQTE
jgi:hypothetical protein